MCTAWQTTHNISSSIDDALAPALMKKPRTTGNKRCRAPSSDSAPPGGRYQALLEWLTVSGATGLSNLEFRESEKSGGGTGVFAKRRIRPGGCVAWIPQSCVLTAAKALSSAVGQTCRKLLPNCTDEFVLVLWMALGRGDPSHPFHAYLGSLPTERTSLVSWPEAHLSALAGTNLGTAVADHRRLVTETYAGLLCELRRVRPRLLPPACDADALAWAYDMYLSRRFPETLAVGKLAKRRGKPRNSMLTQSVGVMLPLFDLLNHSTGTDIDWCGDARGVAFHVGAKSLGVAAGAEVFNNYGDKGNEELMMVHGFAIHNNLHDSYGLRLLMRTSADDPPRCLGVFRMHRSDNPDVISSAQVPPCPSTWPAKVCVVSLPPPTQDPVRPLIRLVPVSVVKM